MNIMNKKCVSLIVLIGILLVPRCVYADLYINFVAVNAADEQRETPIKYYLPKELSREDVLDLGNFQLDYDVKAAAYYVHADVTMGPKESKTFRIRVRDVWYISDEEVTRIKQQIDGNLTLLEDSANHDAGKQIKGELVGRLEKLIAQQESFSGNIDQRVGQYRAYREELEDIRHKASSIDFWQKEKAPRTAAEGSAGLVRLYIEVENPSEDTRTVEQQHYLPKEVKIEHIADSKGFEVRYDEAKQLSYLTREEEFAPYEKKRYEIEIEDIWTIPNITIEDLRVRARKAFDEIEDSDFLPTAAPIFEGAMEQLDIVQSFDYDRSNMKEYISNYRLNKKRIDFASEEIEKLEKIMSTLVVQRLAEVKKSRVRNILQKLQAFQGVAAVSETVFGTKPSPKTVWKIIWAVIIFVGSYTFIHFVIWLQRSKTAKIKEAETKPQQPPAS